MRGALTVETLLISVIAIIFLVFAGNAVQVYGARFVEDVDRMAWIRQSVDKVYASVRLLESCGAGSKDTIDVYVPKGGTIEIRGDTIKGTIDKDEIRREYEELGGGDYEYSVKIEGEFSGSIEIPSGWTRIQLEKETDGEIKVRRMS